MQIDIGMDWEVDLNPIALKNRVSVELYHEKNNTNGDLAGNPSTYSWMNPTQLLRAPPTDPQ